MAGAALMFQTSAEAVSIEARRRAEGQGSAGVAPGMVVHLVHAHALRPGDVLVPIVAYHKRFVQLRLCGRQGEVEQFGPGLQHADVFGQHHLAEVSVDACRAHLAVLQLAEAIGQDVQAIVSGQVVQHFAGMGHQLALGGNYGQEVCGKACGQRGVLYAHLQEGVEETLAVEFCFRDTPLAVFFPQLGVAPPVERVEMVERVEVAPVAILVVHLAEGVEGILREGPQRVVQVEEQVSVTGVRHAGLYFT